VKCSGSVLGGRVDVVLHWPADAEAEPALEGDAGELGLAAGAAALGGARRGAFDGAFRAGGGWLFTSSLTSQHLAELSTVRRRITIRGCKGTRSKQKQPHVNYEGAYRSPALHGRFDLIGQEFWAEHPMEDARKITLRKVDTGNVYVVLDVEGPWKYTAHSIETRKKIKRLIHTGQIVASGNEDIVTAYHSYVRTNAHRFQRLADEFVKLPKDVRSPLWSPPPLLASPFGQPVFMPRGGPIRLGRRTRS